MAVGFGIADFEYMAKLGLRLRNFVRSIKDAPKDFDALRAEADCLEICFHVIEYRECANVLRHVTYKQAEDLRTIMRGCKTNMQELIKFVVQCQRIAIDSAGGRPANKSLWQSFKEWGKDLWAKVDFVWADKQPMRDKLAIPTQSLNIYLVSLTFVSLSYNTRLSGGPNGPLPVPPQEITNWDLVGQTVAFKRATFSYSDLMKAGIENAIVECASRIVHGGSCCEKCKQDENKGKEKKPGGPIPIRVPRRPRRRSSISRGISNNPSGMYLVRSKTPARSKSRTRSSVELVKTTRLYESDPGSGSEDFDVNYISPSGTRSPTRRFAREANYVDEDQVPSARNGPSQERRRERAFDPLDEEDEAEEADVRDARRRGHAAARVEIQKERKEAIDEMIEGFRDERRASQDPSRAGFVSDPTKPDIRAYMEVMYGVIINRAAPEVERINANRSRTPQTPDEPRYFRARTGIHEDVGESDISSGPDSEIEVNSYARREPRSRIRAESRATSFAIPTHEYTPRTEAFEGHHTSTADRDRERSIQEREMSLRDREASMRERETALREREQRFRERQHLMVNQDVSFPPHDAEVLRAREPGRPERQRATRFSDSDLHVTLEDQERRRMRRPSSQFGPEEVHLSPEDHERRRMRRMSSQFGPEEVHLSPEDERRHRIRRQDSYSGSDEMQIIRKGAFEDDDRGTYGRHEHRIDDPRAPKRRPRRSHDSDDDDGDNDDEMGLFVPPPRR